MARMLGWIVLLVVGYVVFESLIVRTFANLVFK